MAEWYWTPEDHWSDRTRFHDHRSCLFMAKLLGVFDTLKKQHDGRTSWIGNAPAPKCAACNLQIDCKLDKVEALYRKREQRKG